jgi:ATP-binding cassette, subfamily G (WHITE), member 1
VSYYFFELTCRLMQFLSVTYVSYVRYGFEGAMISVYGYSRPKLDCPEMFCHIRIPSKFLKDMSMPEDNFWLDVGALSGIFIVLRIIAYFVLRWRLHSIR